MSIEQFFDQALNAAVENGASDVHLTAGCPVRARIRGQLQSMGAKPLRVEDTRSIAAYILKKNGRLKTDSLDELFKRVQDEDCSYGLPGVGRFRVNICLQRGSVALVLRSIPAIIPSIESLRLPKVVHEIALEERGLVLVTGMTGSGKSTTLAAMIGLVNATKACKIVTIEDPIEFLHNDNMASVMQREVGSDTETFARAMRAALRQDPDVILVGEMRDQETVETALKAAETGHLVMSTLHTTDAPKTINRIISFFSPAEQNIVRLRLSDALKAVVSQRLLPTADGQGRVAAIEVLRSTASIKDCIAIPEKSGNIMDYVRQGRDQYGMQTFDQHLYELHQAGMLSFDVARNAASSPAEFERALVYI